MRRQQHGVENWLGWVDWGGAEVGSVGCRHRENPRSQQKASRQMTFKKKKMLFKRLGSVFTHMQVALSNRPKEQT